MRGKWGIGLFLAVVFMSACHTPTREAKRMVKRAYLLADTLPDSTARLIDSVLRMPASFSERERMDMVLTHTLALYQGQGTDLHYAAEHTSSELSQACAYFAKKKDYEKATKAALYMGYMLDEMGYELKEAVKYLKDAEYYGTLSHDTLFVAKAQHRLAYLILEFDQTLGENLTSQEGINLLDKAATGYKSDDYSRLARLFNVKTMLYAKIQDFDHAEECTKTSLEYAEKCHSIELRNSALHHLSLIYRKQGKIEESIDCIRSCFASGDTIGMPNFLYQIATSFYALNELDSALYYVNRLEHQLSILENTDEEKPFRMKCYNMISHFYEDQGNDSLAIHYVRKHESLYYKQVASNAEKNVYNIQQRYDYEVLQNKMNKEITKRHRVIIWIFLIMMLFLIGFAISQIRLAQKNKKEAETKANLFHFMQQNKALIESNRTQERKVLDTTQQLSDLLSARLMAMQKLDYSLKNPKDKIALKDLEREVFGDGDHWEAVKEVLDALYPGLWETLGLKYPDMDEMERRVYMLSQLKLSRLGEATLLGISTSVLDKIRGKVRKMMEQP
jgi:hypothetical protein